MCVHTYIEIYISEGTSTKKSDLSHSFLNHHPGQLTLWIQGAPDLCYFPFGWGETSEKSCYWDHCFSSLCSGLLNSDEHELFTGAVPALLDLTGFCESACLPAKLISQSIVVLRCALLCWDLKCWELFLLDKHKNWNHEVLAGSKLCQLNTYLFLAATPVFNILVLLC